MPNLDKDYYLDKSGLATLINELETNVVAEEYDSSATYALGDYCIHDNKLYRCTTAISTAESWTSGHWSQVLVGDELGTKGSIWQGTQAQYDAITNPDPNTTYYITDSVSPSLQVSNLTDVSLTNITNGQTLVYQSGTWVNDEAGGKVWQGTQAQYDAITTPDPDMVYYITDSTQSNFALADLSNVSLSQLTDGEVLKYDSTNNIWTNGTGGGGTWVGTQAQYDAIVTPDPDTTYYITDGVANGYQLWKGTQAQYDAITTPDDNTIYCITDSEDVTVNLSDLGDTDISSPSAGQIIQYSSNGKWTNSSIDVVIDLSDLGDTNITSPSNGQLLTYSSGEWVNQSVNSIVTYRAYAYRLTSTTSFSAACTGTVFTDQYGLGNFLDTKVHAIRNSFSTTAVNYIHDSVGGAMMFAQVFAYGASYYCGTVNTYHADNKVYGGFGFVNFQYMNGTYVIQYISNSGI